MSEWITYKLESVISSVNTGLDAIQRAPIVIQDTGIKCLRIQDISQGKEFANWGFTKVREDNFKRFQLIEGDVIIARTGETVGVNKYIDKSYQAVYNNGLIRIRFNKSIVYPKFGYYQFRTDRYKGHINGAARGTSTQPNMKIQALLDFEFSLPDLTTQTQIAQILTSLDDKIELNLQMNQTLEAIAQNIFKEWFVNFNFPNFDGELENGLPKDWRKCQVKDICEANASTLNSKDVINEVHYIEISEVDRGVIKNVSVYTRGKEPSRAKRKLQHGDTVLSTVRPNRGSYFLSILPVENLIASTGFAVFSPTTVPFSYLYIFLTNDDQLEFYGKMADGGAYPAINQSVIMNMEVTLPTKEILQMYHNVSGNLLIRISENLEANKILEKTRNTLLPKLMSGKLELV